MEVVPKMDARLAEIMVRRWQAAKARALGSAHDMAALPEVYPYSCSRSNNESHKNVSSCSLFN